MAYKLQLKRGVLASLPNGSVGEPLFTTDTFDLYVGKGDGTNVKLQKFIASGSSSQFLKGDGSLDSNTYQGVLSGSGIVKSTGGTISYLTDNSANWDSAYNDKINSASVSGTTTKTLTLTQQDGGTITASWSDYDTAPVTSVFGRTGVVVAASGDYTTSLVTEGTNLYFTDARARAAITLTTTGSSGSATYVGGTLNVPTYTLAGLGGVPTSRSLTINGTSYDLSADRSWSVGTVTSVDLSVPTGFAISGNPITSSGTLALAFASGYSLPTNASQTNWDAAYNDKINSASVTGTTTKTLTLTQQDGGTITASWTDDNTDAVSSVFGRTGAVVAQSGDYTTTQVTEGTNLYYTDARSRAALSFVAGSGAYNSTTGVITIPTNTNQLTNGASFITLASLSGGAGISYNNTTGVIASTITQYTDAMARASISGGTGISYNSTTGVITNTITQYTDAMARASLSFVAGSGAYNSTTGVITIPTNTNQLTNGAAFITLGSLSASAPLSYNNGTGAFTISQASSTTNGFLSSTDWNTFNNKQNALTNPVTGTGTTNYVTKWTSSSAVGNSQIFDNGTSVGINNISPQSFSDGRIKTIDGKGTDGFVFIGQGTNTQLRVGADDSIGGIINCIGAYPLAFYTNASERLRITSSGNIGIGTTSPENAAGYATITINGSSGGQITFATSNSKKGYLYNNATNMYIGSESGALIFDAGAIEAMRITSGRNVGIGTTSPTSYTGFTTLSINNSTHGGVLDLLVNNVRTGSVYTGLSGSDFNINAVTSIPMIFSTSNTERMRLDASGNLAIGTTSANRRLTVGGSANAYMSFNASSNRNTTIGSDGFGNFIVYDDTASAYRMVINSSGKVGIGTTSPDYLLDARLSTNTDALQAIARFGANNLSGQLKVLDIQYTGSSNLITLRTNAVGTDPNIAFNIGNVEVFRALGSGNLLVGTTTDNGAMFQVHGTGYFGSTLTLGGGSRLAAVTGNGLNFNTGGADRMLLDASGNLGLGVVPSAWASARKAIELGKVGASLSSGANVTEISLSANAYDATGGWTYAVTGATTLYQQNSGSHAWYNAPSGTAGNAITFTQAMTLDASGRLGIGTTSPNRRLQVESDGINWGTALFGGVGGTDYVQIGNLGLATIAAVNSTLSAYTALSIQPNGGNLLVGTSTDSGYKLDINGTGKFRSYVEVANSVTVSGTSSNSIGVGALYQLYNSSNGYSSVIQLNASGGTDFWNINSGTSWQKNLTIAQDGAATFSSSVTAGGNIELTSTANTVFTNKIAVVSSAADMLINASSASMIFNAAGAERMRLITGSGNLLIGTTTDNGARLQVSNGNLTIADSVSPRVSVSGNGATGFPGYNLSNTGQQYEIIVRGNQSNALQIRNATASTDLLSFASTGAATFSSTIQTAAPTGYTAQPWKLGDATSGTITPNYYIKVEINGQIYSIPALQGTP